MSHDKVAYAYFSRIEESGLCQKVPFVFSYKEALKVLKVLKILHEVYLNFLILFIPCTFIQLYTISNGHNIIKWCAFVQVDPVNTIMGCHN